MRNTGVKHVIHAIKQVPWLAVTKVRRVSARLFAGTWRPRWVLLQHCIMLRLVFIVQCGIARFLCAMRVFDVRASSIDYLCAKFRFFRGLHCWASPWRKIAYSLTHSLSLFDAPGTKAPTLRNKKPTILEAGSDNKSNCKQHQHKHIVTYWRLNKSAEAVKGTVTRFGECARLILRQCFF